MLRALLNNKYLVRELVARDIHTRYVGSLVGIFWSILNPLTQLVLYTIIFGEVMQQRFDDSGSRGMFALYLFCALLPWMAIQESVTRASRTFIENANLIKKVRFPLETLPLGLTLSAFVHQCLGTVIFVIALVAADAFSYRTFALAFVLFGFQLMMTHGLSLTAACLNVFIRDIAQILGVAFMLLFWMTPIVYPKSQAPVAFRWILDVNPLTHMVEAYRHVFLGADFPSAAGFVYWMIFSVAALKLGQIVLRRTRRDLVDLI